MSDNSVSLHRVIKASPEKVYRAFTEPTALASWMPPYGFLGIIHGMDVKPGGTFKMSFQNFTTGSTNAFGGEYLEVVPNELLKYTDKFEDSNLTGTIVNTIWFTKTSVGTDLKILQENIPAMIPVEMCYLGWQESLEKLIKLVEPNIPDA
ncbi:SRPBCC family protein [Pedobacter sp. D749]|uniref:SRPBCC family protein n=1 Tax=Pedobacter sp. D749 TaxID=2856523 RepID=UPI001043B286|nr:SRPBCC family protein [Pedobacter sp. D749]QXU43185.1 SRPBCC family protein [Pedobacter sp. D749]